MDRPGLRQLLAGALRPSIGGASQSEDITLPARHVHCGPEKRLILEDGSEAREPEPILVKPVAQAMSARWAFTSPDIDPLTNHYSKRHLWQLLRISYLAPDIITTIIEGRQPPSRTGRRLLRVTDLPLDWSDQRKLLGFA